MQCYTHVQVQAHAGNFNSASEKYHTWNTHMHVNLSKNAMNLQIEYAHYLVYSC